MHMLVKYFHNKVIIINNILESVCPCMLSISFFMLRKIHEFSSGGPGSTDRKSSDNNPSRFAQEHGQNDTHTHMRARRQLKSLLFLTVPVVQHGAFSFELK